MTWIFYKSDKLDRYKKYFNKETYHKLLEEVKHNDYPILSCELSESVWDELLHSYGVAGIFVYESSDGVDVEIWCDGTMHLHHISFKHGDTEDSIIEQIADLYDTIVGEPIRTSTSDTSSTNYDIIIDGVKE